MRTDTDWSGPIMYVFTGILLFAMILRILGHTPVQINERWEKDAVGRGYGEYIVDENRHVQFVWKTNTVAIMTNVVYVP